MPQRIDCETFQVYGYGHRGLWTPGLAVTEDGSNAFIDPQLEFGLVGQRGASRHPERWIALSKASPPRLERRNNDMIVRKLSLNASIIESGYHTPKTHFRAFNEQDPETENRHALVGLVANKALDIVFSSGVYLLSSHREQGPIANLILMAPDSRIRFERENEKSGDTFVCEAINDTDKGFTVKHLPAKTALASF